MVTFVNSRAYSMLQVTYACDFHAKHIFFRIGFALQQRHLIWLQCISLSASGRAETCMIYCRLCRHTGLQLVCIRSPIGTQHLWATCPADLCTEQECKQQSATTPALFSVFIDSDLECMGDHLQCCPSKETPHGLGLVCSEVPLSAVLSGSC